MNTLVNTALLDKIIECAILSPYIQGEHPISLLIVAKPESGKTSSLKRYIDTQGVIYLTDITAYSLQTQIFPQLKEGKIKTLIIGDLITQIAKQTKTRQTFIGAVNYLVEEGAVEIHHYGMDWKGEVKANLITAVTDQELRDARHGWAKMGFLSRFIIFAYSYDEATINRIMKRYSTGGIDQSKAILKPPKKEINIELPPEIADRLDPIAREVGKQLEIYGIRSKINFRGLLKALALRNQKALVTEAEYDEFAELADYMNIPRDKKEPLKAL